MEFESKNWNVNQSGSAPVGSLSTDKPPNGRAPNLEIKLLPVSSLTMREDNPRKHSPKQIRQIADSILQFGFLIAILIDGFGRVIAGHGRVLAAKLLGYERVPTVSVEHLTEAQIRAFLIADNKLTENAKWDLDLLSTQFKFLDELELGFDLEITGFETAEIDILLDKVDADKNDLVDNLPALEPPVSCLGDRWNLNKHVVVCADATIVDSFELLMQRKKASMVFVDPPYNDRVADVTGLGSIKHREFPMASGDLTEEQYRAFLSTVFTLLIRFSVSGSIHFVCTSWRHLFELLSAARGAYTALMNICIWNKSNGGMGSLYRSKYEAIGVFKNGTAPHSNNNLLGRYGRNRNNVWDYPGVNSFRAGRLEELAMHPTVKPVRLVADAILDCSKRKDLILDCFGGSGTTLIAAEQTGRIAYLMELDPGYVDLTIRRFQKLTGEAAIHAETGLTFAETQRARATEAIAGDKAKQQ